VVTHEVVTHHAVVTHAVVKHTAVRVSLQTLHMVDKPMVRGR
jgi:hypothetical protein